MQWYVDSGHAWLKVYIKNLVKLGIADKISIYSYVQGSFAYLEEDCDAPIYYLAIGKTARDFPEQHFIGEAPCRNMRPYQAHLIVSK